MERKPNFVLIFPDQWRGDCLGSLGHPAQTPFLDEIASGGVTFTGAYSACPSCIASRASLITGQTPSTCGRLAYGDKIPFRYKPTLMSCLRDSGYQTLCSGKTHFYPQRVALGFEELKLYDVQNLEGDFISDYHQWLEKEGKGAVKDTALETGSNNWLAVPWTGPEYLHPNTWTMDTALEMLKRRDPTRPFFIQISFHRPHPPYDPPVSFFSRYRDIKLPPVPAGEWAEEFNHPVDRVDAYEGRLPDHVLEETRKAYYAQLTHIDYQIGKLLYFLRTTKKWLPDTYIIFVSDHGELLGDNHLFRKFNAFEGSAHIPLIIMPPTGEKGFQRGILCDKPVTHMDLMPAILEAAGVSIPDSVEGKSIMPLITGAETKWRESIHGEHSPCWQFVTDGYEKFIWRTDTGREYFFNLREDPGETRDLSSDPQYAERVNIWRNRLISVLSQRPQDGLTDGKKLLAGKKMPAVRKHLLEPQLDADGKIRPDSQLRENYLKHDFY
ncbi:MAG: arylsulfatase [Candidatus Omnitrophica bacterium]|nr:arylsulfatase [Candidatus Omnitrophota bacterium]